MIGKFLFGAFFGGVTVAGGLVAASLVTPVMHGAEDASSVEAPPAVKPEVQTTPEDAVAAASPDQPDVAAEVSGAVPVPADAAKADSVTDPVVEVAVADPVAVTIPEATQPETATPITIVPATEAPATAEVAEAVPEVSAEPNSVRTTVDPNDEVATTLQPEASPSPADTSVQAPASEPVTAVEEPTIEVASEAPAVVDSAPPELPEQVEADVASAAVKDVPAPIVPQDPIQPPAPDQDEIVAALEGPVLAPATPDVATVGTAKPVLPATDMTQSPGAALGAEAEMAPDAPVMPTPDAAVVILEPQPAPPEPDAEPQIESARLPADEGAQMPGTKPAGLPGADRTTEAEAVVPEPDLAEVAEAEADPGPTLKPAPGLVGGADGVIIGRLPKIGDAPAPETLATEIPATVEAEDLRPIVLHAAAFENPEGKPLFSIVLIDSGAPSLNRTALADLPFPVSFALDPLDPATAERAAIYRSAGKEVVMLATGIVEGAQASDVEVAFQAMEQGLPEAVAVMDLPEKRFQDNRPLASLVVPVIASQGRGLLTWDQGLNAADQVARREDLAAAVVFRPIDAVGEDDTAIRRGLDRAAFKSAQDGRVTVVGRTTDETIAALLEWTVEGRAATVALAPLSAVLTID